MVLRRLAWISLALLGSACFERPKPNCAFLCGTQGACPTDYSCGGDSRCHLVVNGSPQACTDGLPGDASTLDAPRPDANVPDAAGPDATPNQAPTLSTNPTGPTVNAVAGNPVTITASATDPDAGDTLTFAAAFAGTNQNPFTLSGATFSTTTHVFSMTAGVLGDFDVTFSVNDGHGHNVTKTMTIHVTPSPVMLNEIQQGALPAQENIELLNNSGAAVTITGWRLCDGAACYTFPTASIAANSFVVLHWWQASTDTTTDFYDGALPPSTLSDVVLAAPGTGNPGANDFLSYVRTATSAPTASTQSTNAVTAKQWPTATSFVDTTGAVDGNSVSRKNTPAIVNTQAPGDWTLTTTTSIGVINP